MVSASCLTDPKQITTLRNIIFYLAILLFSCREDFSHREYRYVPPPQVDDGWITAPVSGSEIDTARIFQFMNAFVKRDHQVSSVLIVKNDTLLLEEYFNGNDKNSLHDLRSATKSVRSLLVGIALQEGFIGSLDDPILNYLGELVDEGQVDPEKRTVTIRHLLTMSPGWDCNDWNKDSAGQEDRIHRKKNWLQYIMQLPMQFAPGDTSMYCSAATILAAEVVSRASSMSVEAFAEKYLFGPLGISNYRWGHTTKKNVPESARRLYLTSRDFAKIGQLVLDSGRWQNQPVVSSEWIRESTRVHTQITGVDYGYLWWRIPLAANGSPVEAVEAMGNGGQYLMLFPKQDIMLVFNGTAYNSEEDKLPFQITNQIFIPALKVFSE